MKIILVVCAVLLVICANASAHFSEEETVDSDELALVVMGCKGCQMLATRITSRIHRYTFRDILSAVGYGCTAAVPNCHAFISTNEDELIDAIYHYKSNTLAICRALHQC